MRNGLLLSLLLLGACSHDYSKLRGHRDGSTDASTDGSIDSPDSGDRAAAGTDGGRDGAAGETGSTPTGQPCGNGSQCGSGFCFDGVCCKTDCSGVCQTCAAQGSVGTCMVAEAGSDPRDECGDEGASSCGHTGTCDGKGACEVYGAGVVCRQAACSGSTLTSPGRCDGAGKCGTVVSQSCTPFMCGTGGQCKTVCTADADCISGTPCVSGSCGKKPIGASCALGTECNSTICAQGVCCATTCSGTCKSCAVSDSAGSCINVPSGQDPLGQCTDAGAAACGLDGTCDGAGACRKYASGIVCGTDSCTAGTATLAGRCSGPGVCQAGLLQACSPYVCSGSSCLGKCATNADCATGYVCNGTICGKKGNGVTCTTALECASGYCEQGYCCNTGCAAACVACNLPSTLGTCSPISAGQPPSLTTQCVAAAATTCGNDGTCNGAGACRQHIAGTMCGPAACVGSTLTSARTCDGAGLCRQGNSSGCDPFVCGTGGACNTTCSTSADCVSPSTCVGMSCGKKPNGATCAIATECNSGVCAQGVCCATACAGTCKSCALSGSAGTCANVPAGQTPTPATQCIDGGATACGNDGTCNGNGACRTYVSGTLCAGATCNSATYTAARLCDGAGTCASASSSSCGVYVCDASAKVCKTTCSTNADCASPNICNGGTCSKKGLGTALHSRRRSATRASAPKGCAVPARAPAPASPAHGPEAPAPAPTSRQAKLRLLRPNVSTLAL